MAWRYITIVMDQIYHYFDYRDFLREYYESQKREHSWFSLRLFGSKIGMDAGYLLKIMQKQAHLSLKKAASCAKSLDFSPEESAFFELLVGFNRAKTESQAAAYFEKMTSFKEVGQKQLIAYQYKYYRKWYYSAVLAAIGYFPVAKNYRKLARHISPHISAAEAREACEVLQKLGLIRRDSTGVYERTHRHISTGPHVRSLAVRRFQQDMISLSQQSLERIPKEQRDISTVTVNMNRTTLEDIREILRQCRRSIITRISEDRETDCVYQINMQVFPLSDPEFRNGDPQ